MINMVMIIIITITTAISGGVGYFTLTRMKSVKREFFVLFVFCVFIYELGYILEMTATTADGGLVATKIMYAGSEFIAPLFLIFIQKYCEIKLPRFINTLLFLSAAAVVILVWTSEHHTLYYTSYWYDNISEVHHLGITGGPLYPFGIFHPVVCIACSLGILIKKRQSSEPDKRKRLNVFILCALAPIFSHVLYFFNLNIFGANYAPLFLMGSMVGLYFGLIKYDLLENEETIRSQTWFRDMVANISHDLKTPLSVLSINLETLTWLSKTQSDSEYQRHVRAAYQKNLDLQRLVQNLFEVSRIETGREFYSPKWVSLIQLLAQANKKYDDFLEDRGISFGIEPADDALISTDFEKIWSVFDNIIYNAARHTESGGSITITVQAGEASVLVKITDTGCGIAPEHLAHIFERFYKASKSRSEKGGDSGLGLYIVKSLMEGCGGSVSAESKIGKGTSIILTFPARPQG